MPDKMKSLALGLAKIRGNPIYMVKLNSIGGRSCLQCQQHFKGKKYDTLDVIIQSPGGDISVAYNIARVLRKHSEKVTGIIPYYAKSAATLICLSMDELILGELGELGPLDTQILEYKEDGTADYTSALNSFKALEQLQKYALESLDIAVMLILRKAGIKITDALSQATDFASILANPLFSQINPSKLGEHARALDTGYQYGLRILTRYMKWDSEKAKSFLNALVKGYPSHDFILDVEELQSLGLTARYADDKEQSAMCYLTEHIIETQKDIINFLVDEEDLEKIKVEREGDTP